MAKGALARVYEGCGVTTKGNSLLLCLAGRYFAYLWDRSCATKICIQVHTAFHALTA